VVSLVSANSLVLSWSGPCYDGGSAVLGYVVEVKGQGGAESVDWSELTARCESTSFRVSSGLQPHREYCFRVRAYNAVGASEAGPVSLVVRMEEKGEATWVSDATNIMSLTLKLLCLFFFFLGVEKPKEEEAPPAYSRVTINSSEKVSDHYSLQERLGM